ncbi:MAG: ABC transporter ATP-binding protein [Anaerolineae bacterium]
MAKTSTSDFQHLISVSRFKGVWGLLAGFRRTYVGAIGSLAVATIARTGTFLLIGYLVDQVLTRSDLLAVLPLVAFGFVLLALTQGGGTYLSGRWSSQTAEGIARRLRNYLYDHIQRMSFAYHDRTPTGDLIQRATSDVDAVRRFFSEQAPGISRILLLFIVNWAALWQLNTQLALYSVVVVPIILTMSIFFFRRVSRVYEHYQEQDAKLSTTLQENLTGVRVVKAFARQEYEKEKFEQDNIEKYRRGVKLLRLHASFWPIADILCNSQLLAGFALGAVMTINQQITLGEYVSYVGLVVLLIWPMREMGRMIVQASTGLVSFGRVMEIIRQAREPIEEAEYLPLPGSRIHGAVEFCGVGFEYEKDVDVLHDISFCAEPGQVIALMGPTGSGKTTLVNLLPRFYEYTAGRILLDGVELKQYSRQYLRRQIGIVEQEPFLFSRSIRENITYGVGREVSDAEVYDAARAAAIHDVILSFPDGYKTLVGEKGITLSGGQKQRVAIARTLLKNPRVLILDDSTSSVDTETEAAIREALEKLMRKRTTFVIAHRIQSVMSADQILVLDRGRIVQRGTHEELAAQDGLYRRIYELQARIESEVEKEVGAAPVELEELERQALAA